MGVGISKSPATPFDKVTVALQELKRLPKAGKAVSDRLYVNGVHYFIAQFFQTKLVVSDRLIQMFFPTQQHRRLRGQCDRLMCTTL